MNALELSRENERLKRWLHLTVSERLVEYLFLIASERDGQLVIVQPPTTVAMALAIGTHRAHVSRKLMAIERAGMIISRRRGKLERISMTLTAKAHDMLAEIQEAL